MREKWMRFISLFLVGILCCSIFAGCSSNVSEEDICLLYTSDAADEEDSVDLGGRRNI